jgi:flagellar protein FlaH
MSQGRDGEEKLISFGKRAVDDKLDGGIPQGSLVLIDGRFDAGKSLVSQEFVWGALQGSHHVVLYVTEHDTLSLLQEMDYYGMDATDYFLLGRLNIYPVPSGGRRTATESFTLLHDHFRRLVDFDVVVVDAMTTFAPSVSDESLLSFFTACKDHCSRGKTVAFTIHSHVLSTRLLAQVHAICSVHLRLRLDRFRERIFNVLEVAVLRSAPKTRGNTVSFEIEPGYGIKDLPFGTLQAG